MCGMGSLPSACKPQHGFDTDTSLVPNFTLRAEPQMQPKALTSDFVTSAAGTCNEKSDADGANSQDCHQSELSLLAVSFTSAGLA